MFIFILNSVFNQFCVFSDSFAFEGGGGRGAGCDVKSQVLLKVDSRYRVNDWEKETQSNKYDFKKNTNI